MPTWAEKRSMALGKLGLTWMKYTNPTAYNATNPNYNPTTGSSTPNGGTYFDTNGDQLPLTYVPKADGGYDFFVNGQSASAQDYQAMGGQLPAGAPLSDNTFAPSTNPNNRIPLGLEGTSGDINNSMGTGTGGTIFQPIQYKGVIYYDEPSYISAVNKNIADTYESNLATIQRNYQNGLMSVDDRDAAIKHNRETLRSSYQTDLQNVSGYFNRISPDAIQSQQSNLEAKSTNQYNQGNAQLGQEFDQSLYDANGRLKSDLTDAQLAPYMSQANTSTGSLARAYSGYANQRIAQTQLATDQRQQGLDSTANSALDFANKVSAPTIASQVYNNVLSGDTVSPNSSSPAITKKKFYDENGNEISPIDLWQNQ